MTPNRLLSRCSSAAQLESGTLSPTNSPSRLSSRRSSSATEVVPISPSRRGSLHTLVQSSAPTSPTPRGTLDFGRFALLESDSELDVISERIGSIGLQSISSASASERSSVITSPVSSAASQSSDEAPIFITEIAPFEISELSKLKERVSTKLDKMMEEIGKCGDFQRLLGKVETYLDTIDSLPPLLKVHFLYRLTNTITFETIRAMSDASLASIKHTQEPSLRKSFKVLRARLSNLKDRFSSYKKSDFINEIEALKTYADQLFENEAHVFDPKTSLESFFKFYCVNQNLTILAKKMDESDSSHGVLSRPGESVDPKHTMQDIFQMDLDQFDISKKKTVQAFTSDSFEEGQVIQVKFFIGGEQKTVHLEAVRVNDSEIKIAAIGSKPPKYLTPDFAETRALRGSSQA